MHHTHPHQSHDLRCLLLLLLLLLLVVLPGIPGSVEFVDGTGGLPTVMLKHACGASAQVHTTSSSSSKQASICYNV
jgi:hypothetical protein